MRLVFGCRIVKLRPVSNGLRYLATGMVAAFMALPCFGQPNLDETASKEFPKAPPNGVLDVTRFLSRDSKALHEISDSIQKLAQDHDFHIYLVIEPVLIATTPQELAADYRQAWLPGGNGLVIVFEADSRRMGIGQDITGDVTDPGNPARVPAFETAAILQKVYAAVNPTEAPEAYLKAFVGNLTGEFGTYFVHRNTPPPSARSVKTVLVIVGTISLLGLGAIGVGSMLRHSGMHGPRSFRFPKVDRPERLAAPCGAAVTSRRFALKPRA
ncbi:MAG: hypothetical protein H7Y36_12630 [Armatimonadetes bacterium]|nr:hypothetical protein [Akkermansiaceae bacterium]